MPTGPWQLYSRAKRAIGAGGVAMASGGITLGAGVFKLTLHRPSASANIMRISNGGISTWASVGSEVAGGYGGPPGGYRLSNVRWTVDAVMKDRMNFQFTTLMVTCRSTMSQIKYAVIRTSTGPTAGKVICFCTLTATPITITNGWIMISNHVNGSTVFFLA